MSLDSQSHDCQFVIDDLVDCQRFAERLAQSVSTPLVIALHGTLGAGKTQWTRFFSLALGADDATISSPTFVLVQQYDSKPTIYHLDAYRIGDEDEMLELGVEELFDCDAVTIIEWADRFPNVLPRDRLTISLDVEVAHEAGDTCLPLNTQTGTTRRLVRVTAKGRNATQVWNRFALSLVHENRAAL